jgi:iodothyronine deiodinase-like protein
MYDEYKYRADFLAVYIREAHPLDEWQMKSNVDENICYPQPKNFAQRVAIANDFVQRFHFLLPIAVDTMADAADQIYAAWPERLYVIDESGKIVYRGGLGPFHYHPEEVRAWLAQRFPATSVGN